MICSRCAYCCLTSMVVIVDDPDRGIEPDNLKPIGFKGPERCQHLRGDRPGEYSCAVHDREWYPETPCAQYQSHWPERHCPMGRHLTQEKT